MLMLYLAIPISFIMYIKGKLTEKFNSYQNKFTMFVKDSIKNAFISILRKKILTFLFHAHNFERL